MVITWISKEILKLHFQDKIWMVPPFPSGPPPVDNFFTLHLTKNIIEHKRCRIRFQNGLYACLISAFTNNKHAMYEFWIFDFFFQKWVILAYFDLKLPFFFIEITLKLLHTKYGWINPNWGRLGLKSPKLHFFAISGSSKFIAYTNIQIYVTGSIFIIIIIIFLKCAQQCPLSHSITIEKSKIRLFMGQRSL